MARLTDPQLLVSQADVLPVFPSGGGGTSHLLYNSISIEMADDDPVAELPEVLRLAWLVAQLNVDLPIFSENLQPGRRPLIASASMIPPVLTAAEEAELARYDLPSVADTSLLRVISEVRCRRRSGFLLDVQCLGREGEIHAHAICQSLDVNQQTLTLTQFSAPVRGMPEAIQQDVD